MRRKYFGRLGIRYTTLTFVSILLILFLIILIQKRASPPKSKSISLITAQGNELSMAITHDHEKKWDTTDVIEAFRHIDSLLYQQPYSLPELLETTLVESEKLDYSGGYMSSAVYLMKYYMDLGSISKAFSYYNLGLQYIKTHKDAAEYEPWMNLVMGIGFYEKYQVDSTLKYLHRAESALNKAKNINYKNAFAIYESLAALWSNAGNDTMAQPYFDKAIQIGLHSKDSSIIMGVWRVKATLFAKQGKHDSVEHYYNYVITNPATSFKDKLTSIYTLANYFIKFKHTPDDFKKAIAYLDSAYLLCKEESGNYNPRLVQYAYMTALAYQKLGNKTKDPQYFHKAIEILNQVKDNPNKLYLAENLFKLHNTLAECYGSIGKYNEAYKHHQLSITLRDSFYKAENQRIITNTEVQYRVAEKDKVLASQNLYILQQRFWIILICCVATILLILTISLLRRKRHKEQLAHLKAMIQGEEQERNRIARDLHDGIGGMLAAVKIGINNLEKNQDGAYLPQGMPAILGLLDDTSQEIRRTAHHLMPEVLTKNSFPQALRSYSNAVQTDTRLQIILQFHTPWVRLNPNMELSLYRIMQELIQNVIRHAEAGTMSIQFRHEGQQRLHITVEDDGKGFDPVLDTPGMGLSNIRSRVNLWQGHLSIESVPGKGSTFYIELPLKQNYVYEDKS